MDASSVAQPARLHFLLSLVMLPNCESSLLFMLSDREFSPFCSFAIAVQFW